MHPMWVQTWGRRLTFCPCRSSNRSLARARNAAGAHPRALEILDPVIGLVSCPARDRRAARILRTRHPPTPAPAAVESREMQHFDVGFANLDLLRLFAHGVAAQEAEHQHTPVT